MLTGGGEKILLGMTDRFCHNVMIVVSQNTLTHSVTTAL